MMKTIIVEFVMNPDGDEKLYYCKQDSPGRGTDHSGVYVPLADYERLRMALEGIATYTHLRDLGGADAIFMRNIARRALEEK